MASPEGFWRFMDDVHEMTFPMACIDWRKTPVIEKMKPGPIEVPFVANPQPATEQPHRLDAINDSNSSDTNGESSSRDGTVVRGQNNEVRQANAPIIGEESLAKGKNPAKTKTGHLLKDLNKQNAKLLQEQKNAVRWQDAASMAIKEAKDDTETREKEAEAMKKAGLQAVARVQRQLDDSRRKVEALEREEVLVAEAKTRAEAEHREEISVAERKVGQLQTGFNSAIASGRACIEVFEDLSQMRQEIHDELVAKNKKLVAKNRENKVLQDHNHALDAIIQGISVEAEKDREACNKYCREKFESEKAQRDAEGRVGSLEREAITAKAKTDKVMQALQTKLNESVAHEVWANTRATKAEGDVAQLNRELENTELARQEFEKKEGKWAALFAADQASARDRSQSTPTAANALFSETEHEIPTTSTMEVEVSKLVEGSPKKNGALLKEPGQQAPDRDPELQEKVKELEGALENWKRNWQVAESKAEDWKRDVRREMDEKNQTTLAAERGNILLELDDEKRKTLAAERKVVRTNAKNSLRARILVKLKSQNNKGLQKSRRRAATEKSKRVTGKKEQAEWIFEKAVSPRFEVAQSQLETKIRTELQTEFQDALSNHKTQWETQYVVVERPRLETQIRTQLQNDFQRELSNFKTKWEAEHLPSENQIVADERGDTTSAIARSADDDMLFASLSRESDETHELFQEIGMKGLPQGSAAYTVLRELNQAKDALYDVKCELRKPDALADKNNLLSSVGSLHINEHYIQKLNVATREVLIRQANEANSRLEHVQKILGTNSDVSKDAMLKWLLAPLKIEHEQEIRSAPLKTTIGSGNAAVPGSRTIPHTLNGLGKAAASSASTFSPTNGSGYSTAPGTSVLPLTVTGFSVPATPGTSNCLAKNVFNPFESSQFASQPPLDSISSQHESMSVDNDSASETLQDNGTIRLDAPMSDQKSVGLGLAAYTTADWNSLNKIVRNAAASQGTTTEPQGTKPVERSSAPSSSSMDFQLNDYRTAAAQNYRNSRTAEETTKARKQQESKFSQTFQPLLPQAEGPAPPASVSVAADPESIISKGGESSSFSATSDHSGVIGLEFVSSKPRQVKKAHSQARSVAPKGRQLAHQAFAKRNDVLASIPNQPQQTSPQEQVPATQQVGSVGIFRKKFTLKPNHGFSE